MQGKKCKADQGRQGRECRLGKAGRTMQCRAKLRRQDKTG
jgi:hypothetical protein